MADAYVTLPSDAANTGRKVDLAELTVNGQIVERQRVTLGDPTNATSLAAVKAASTPAAPADPSLVVAISPNSPLAKAKVRNLAAVVTNIKASAGVLFGVLVVNNTAAPAFVQIFDALIGGVTLGTTTPDLEFLVPANSGLSVLPHSIGVPFATGICAASTTLEGGSVASAAGVQLFAQYV